MYMRLGRERMAFSPSLIRSCANTHMRMSFLKPVRSLRSCVACHAPLRYAFKPVTLTLSVWRWLCCGCGCGCSCGCGCGCGCGCSCGCGCGSVTVAVAA